MNQAKILLLDSDPAGGRGRTLSAILTDSLPGTHFQLRHQHLDGPAAEGCDAGVLRLLSDFGPDLIFVIACQDFLRRAGALLSSLVKKAPRVPVLLVLEAGEPDAMFDLLKLGAADFITSPLRALDILPRVWRLLEGGGRGRAVTETLNETLGLKQLIGESSAFQAEVRKIPLIAKCDASVLISGETGTGKEVCARAIHHLSRRARHPFVPVNCGAIPVELVENELFGHARGAFTGAATAEVGLIGESNGGTLFLDEIDCLPLLAQVKLLRFLQEKEYRLLGSTKTCKADVRIVAASNISLEDAVREGKLRRDLYYRLNVIPIALPPLRERRDDILPLAQHFLSKYAREFERETTDFSPEASRALLLYSWPGNVRELEHVVERAVALAEQSQVGVNLISLPRAGDAPPAETFQEVKTRLIAQFEKGYIEELLLAHRGNITKAADAAHKNRRAFWQLIRKHKINVQTFKAGAGSPL